MTRQRQKSVEKRHFDLFRQLFAREFREELAEPDPNHRGEPDFIIRHEGVIVGVEHTELVETSRPPSGYSMPQIVAFRDRVVQIARETCEQRGIPPLHVTVSFWGGEGSPGGPPEQQRLAEQLADAVEEWHNSSPSESDGHLKFPATKGGLMQVDITCGAISGTSWLSNHRWDSTKGGWVAYSLEHFIYYLQPKLIAKSKKYQSYRNHCEECWLLVVADLWNPSQMFRMPHDSQARTHPYECASDRTFFMEIQEKDLVELQCVPCTG